MSDPPRSRRTAAAAAEAAIAKSVLSPFARTQSSNNLTPNVGRRSGLRKQVSYVEVPVDVEDPDPAEEEDEEETGAEDEQEEDEPQGEQAAENNAEEDVEDSGPREGSPAPKRARGGFRGRPGRRPRGRKRVSGLLPGKSRLRAIDDDDDEERAGSPMDVVQEDDNGNTYDRHKVKDVYFDVINDEVEMTDDPAGEKKIDSKGRLLGGREYKILSFTSDERNDPERLYVLGIDSARMSGYRETGDMVRKCPYLVKLQMTTKEKEKVMALHKGTRSLKFNHMMMFAARNVFKYHGAKIIKDGRWVTDHYYEDDAAAECKALGLSPGDLVGDYRYKPAINDMTRVLQGERAVGAPFYTSSGPSTHWGGNGVDPWTDSGYGNKRAKLMGQGVNPDNWMWKMALGARQAEREITRERAGWTQRPLPMEKLTVFQEQHEDTAVDPAKPGAALTAEEPPYIFPSANTLDGLFPRDEDRKLIAPDVPRNDAEVQDVAAYNDKIMEAIRTGRIIIEDEATTIAGRPFQTNKIKAGKMQGVYDPHTNLFHVPRHLQSTTSTLERASPLPELSTAEKPYNFPPIGLGQGGYNATIGPRKVGHGATGLSSWEYVYDGEGGEERKRKRRKEVEGMMRLVKGAEKWEAAKEDD